MKASIKKTTIKPIVTLALTVMFSISAGELLAQAPNCMGGCSPAKANCNSCSGQAGCSCMSCMDSPLPPPCAAEGTCRPNRKTWGYYPGRWRRWPGDYDDSTGTGEPRPGEAGLEKVDIPPAEEEDRAAPAPSETKEREEEEEEADAEIKLPPLPALPQLPGGAPGGAANGANGVEAGDDPPPALPFGPPGGVRPAPPRPAGGGFAFPPQGRAMPAPSHQPRSMSGPQLRPQATEPVSKDNDAAPPLPFTLGGLQAPAPTAAGGAPRRLPILRTDRALRPASHHIAIAE